MRRRQIVVIAIVLLVVLVKPVNAQLTTPNIEFEHPYTPEEYVEEKIKGRIGPEIKTFVGALAGILVIKTFWK